MNDNLENEYFFNIFQYIKDNFMGLCLFIFAFLIIYFVDYINRLNSLIYSIPAPIPGLNNNIILSTKKKLKKR
jgi:hypothetical protein